MELEVTDSGIGIDEARMEEAFAPFVQLSSSNCREHRGLGLGLALVRRNVTALGATLEVKSKCCVGSRFRVRFPGSPQA
jgi:signal transduction histidine kinase